MTFTEELEVEQIHEKQDVTSKNLHKQGVLYLESEKMSKEKYTKASKTGYSMMNIL